MEPSSASRQAEESAETALSVIPPQSSARSAALRAALAGRTVLERVDQAASAFAPKDRPGLLIFIFHCVFANEGEIEEGIVHPGEQATTAGLARLVDYYREHDYTFVSARDIDNGLPPGGLYAHLTFDDGLANNLRLLDFLPAEEVHATIFPSIRHMERQTAFWWNTVYRERARRGQLKTVPAEYTELHKLSDHEVESRLRQEFGDRALKPVGDLDRPLTIPELRELNASPWVEIGNHTVDHTILPRADEAHARTQIADAQHWFSGTLGKEPFFIAYPTGRANDEVAAIARGARLRLGVTVVPGRNKLPGSADSRMRLKRFRIIFDRREKLRMRAARSAAQLTALTRGIVLRDG